MTASACLILAPVNLDKDLDSLPLSSSLPRIRGLAKGEDITDKAFQGDLASTGETGGQREIAKPIPERASHSKFLLAHHHHRKVDNLLPQPNLDIRAPSSGQCNASLYTRHHPGCFDDDIDSLGQVVLSSQVLGVFFD